MHSSPPRAPALHGNVEDHSPVAILLIDVINAFDFPGGAAFARRSLPVARQIASLASRARQRGVPIIYANDNFGRWRSNLNNIVDACEGGAGSRIAELLAPAEEDYFVLKPKNSAFYTTTLDLLLKHIGVRELVLTGFLADNCVLFSAHDAYVRDYQVIVPCDCVASMELRHKRAALEQMKRVLKADVRPWKTSVKFPRKRRHSK